MRSSKARAFTLMEMLVALGILAVMSGIILGVLSITAKARAKMDRIEERHHTAVVALHWLTRDLASAFVSNHINLNEPRSKTLFEGEENRILFTSMAHERLVADAKESDQMVVEYYLARGDDGNMNLMRRMKPIIDMEPDKGGRVDVVATDVVEFKLLYWDDQQEDWVQEWQVDMEDAYKGGLAGSPTGPTAVSMGHLMKMAQDKELRKFRLPQKVYIRLVLGDEEDNEYVFETEARVHILYPLNF